MLLEYRKRECVNAEEELRLMIELLNKKAFGEPGSSRLELQTQDRPDLDGVLVFIVFVQNEYVNIDGKTVVMPLPLTLCWGGGHTIDSACGVVIEKFSASNNMLRRFLPFTAGSLDELKVKAAAYYG